MTLPPRLQQLYTGKLDQLAHGTIGQNFHVGYTPLPPLKPIAMLSQSKISPIDTTNKVTPFSVAISKPNTI